MRTGKVLYIVAVIAVVMPRASHQQQGAVGVLPAQSGCPQHHECVDRNLCLNGKVITDGSGLLDVRITSSVLLGTVQHCLEPHKVCCSVSGTVDPNRHSVGGIAGSTGATTSTFCNEGHDCVPTYLCHDGELNTSGIGILNPRNRPTSVTCINPDYPSVAAKCCKLPSCTPGDVCLPHGTCDGTLVTDHSGKLKDCFLEPNAPAGVCCTPHVPAPLQTCPGTRVCVPNHQCTAQGTINIAGTSILDVGLHHRCYLAGGGELVGVCCAPPPPVLICPGGETCLVSDLCYYEGNTASSSNSPCYVNPNIVGACCYPAPPPPVPVLDTCPSNSVCLPEILCQGEILDSASNYVPYGSNGVWSECLLSGSGLSVPGVCCRNPTVPLPHPTLPAADKCGTRNYALDTRIKNNDLLYYQAEFAEFPWQAIIFFTNFTYKCGASLIGDRWLLTAAHCVNGFTPGDLRVRLGEYQVDRYDEKLNYFDTLVKYIEIHPLFNPKNLHNDIALIELTEPIKYQYHINTICLPNLGQIAPHGTRCYATGWGKDAFDGGQYQVILKKVEVPTVDQAKCQHLLRGTRLGSFFILDKSFMCAGGEENKDACEGDGGGPLACQDPVTGTYYIAGITAWGIGCGQKDVPGVYVDVQFFREWIDGIIAARQLLHGKK